MTIDYYLMLYFFMDLAFVQSNYYDFLLEAWKIENKDFYEHWDRLNGNSLKGCSYELSHGQISVSEYMDIFRNNNEIIITATVVNPNEGQDGNLSLLAQTVHLLLKFLIRTSRKRLFTKI